MILTAVLMLSKAETIQVEVVVLARVIKALEITLQLSPITLAELAKALLVRALPSKQLNYGYFARNLYC